MERREVAAARWRKHTGALQCLLFQQHGAPHGSVDAAQDMRQVGGAERHREAGEIRPMRAQPHGDEQFLAAVEDPPEQAGKAPGAERTLADPIGIGWWG